MRTSSGKPAAGPRDLRISDAAAAALVHAPLASAAVLAWFTAVHSGYPAPMAENLLLALPAAGAAAFASGAGLKRRGAPAPYRLGALVGCAAMFCTAFGLQAGVRFVGGEWLLYLAFPVLPVFAALAAGACPPRGRLRSSPAWTSGAAWAAAAVMLLVVDGGCATPRRGRSGGPRPPPWGSTARSRSSTHRGGGSRTPTTARSSPSSSTATCWAGRCCSVPHRSPFPRRGRGRGAHRRRARTREVRHRARGAP
ncbi:hypothetical protein ACFQXA_34585 [Nocardiopsis composta]